MSNRTGTVNALTSALTFNGRSINPVEFGILANVLGDTFATKVGTAPKPEGQRGKAATIWKLADNSPVVVAEAVPVAAPMTDEAPTVETAADESASDEVVSQNDESNITAALDPFDTAL